MKINSFNPVASRYSRKVTQYRTPQYLTLVHELNLSGYETVLDIGIGSGELSIQIARQLNTDGFLYGVDLSPEMIKLAKRKAQQANLENISFELGDALNLKYDDNAFDVITSSNAYPWVSDREKFLHEAFRVLKPGGIFGLVALSNKCYTEFSSAFKKVLKAHPGLFPIGQPFEIMGAKLHTVNVLTQAVRKAGFDIEKGFTLSTEEPIKPVDYIERVNAIVNENYLDYLPPNGIRNRVKQTLNDALASKNGSLKITESSVFILARKTQTVNNLN